MLGVNTQPAHGSTRLHCLPSLARERCNVQVCGRRAPPAAWQAQPSTHRRRTFQTSPSAGMSPWPITKSRISDRMPLE